MITTIGWGLPCERLVSALLETPHVNLKPLKQIDVIKINPQAEEIYICGTYFDNVEAIVAAFPKARFTLVVNSPEDIKEAQEGPTVKYILVEDLLAPFVKAHPWIRNILRRRTIEAKDEDSYFYRGLIHRTSGAPLETGFRHCITKEWVVDELIEIGKILVQHMKQAAAFDVQEAGCAIKAGKQNAFLVSGGWSGVVPLVSAAADKAEIGINLRYNFATNHTHLSFRTNQGADLSFVNQSPFNGGGSKNVKGATIPGLVRIQAGQSLEDCVLDCIFSQ